MIQFSEASNLAIHAMAYIAATGPGARLSATAIAHKLGRSESHIAKVLHRLAALGLLDSSRGASGGFRLNADPDTISVRQIIEAIEGPLRPPQCLLGQPICDAKSCVFREMFGSMWVRVTQHLADTKLTSFRIQT